MAADLKKLTRIVFVDDERDLLRVYENTLYPVREEWEASFVESGREALQLMEQNPFDIVVADLEMPGMNGLRLLKEVRTHYPQTIRLILSTYNDDSIVLRCLGDSHQYLTKPFDLTELLGVLERIRNLRSRVDNPALKSLIGRIMCLPSVPSVFFKILEALEDQDCSVDDIGNIISTDPGLTAQLLKLVNSAYFGFPQKVISASESVQLIGLSRIRSLVLSLKLFSVFETAGIPGMSVEQVWQHSMNVGMAAQQICLLETGNATMAEEAFTAGLLHDIGKLMLGANFSREYADVLSQVTSGQVSLCQGEIHGFNASHADIGAYLLGIWGLPASLVEAVMFHHDPQVAAPLSFSVVVAVHVANALINRNALQTMAGGDSSLDMQMLKRLGLDKQLSAWERKLAVSK